MRGGAALYSHGKHVNNLLAYPGLLKGALDTQATHFSEEMFLAATEALVRCAASLEDEIVPNGYDPDVHKEVAKAVAAAAIKSGVARKLL